MVARSFRQEAIQEMYKLPVPQRKLDQYFVNKFEAKELEVKLTTLPEVIEEWWHNASPLKPTIVKIPTNRIKRPQRLEANMLCKLYGEKAP